MYITLSVEGLANTNAAVHDMYDTLFMTYIYMCVHLSYVVYSVKHLSVCIYV